MRKLIKKIQDFLDRDIREMIFKREIPQAPVVLPQAQEPTESIAAKPLAATQDKDKPSKKPRKKRQTRKI